MFNRGVQKKQKDNVSHIRPVKTPAGRERLQHFTAEVAKANEAIADLEKRVQRLGSIIVDADAADRALHLAIANDGGVALAAYSAGNGDDETTRLVITAEKSARAAAAAKAALPVAEAALANARDQEVALQNERGAEVGRYMVQLGDDLARKYKAAFAALCIAHDNLAGFAAGAGLYEITMIVEPLTAPRFDLPSLTVGQTEFDPLMRHTGSQLTIGESAKTWASVRQRLEADVDADLSDLLSL